MMKKVLFCISMLFCLSVSTVFAGDKIPMTHMPAGSTHGGSTKSPVNLWYIALTDNIITMSTTPCDYTLRLYDEDGEIVYSVFVPAGTTQVILPTTLSGDFELRFETDTYYYHGFINL